jgi:hypothetical protein
MPPLVDEDLDEEEMMALGGELEGDNDNDDDGDEEEEEDEEYAEAMRRMLAMPGKGLSELMAESGMEFGDPELIDEQFSQDFKAGGYSRQAGGVLSGLSVVFNIRTRSNTKH